MTQDSEARSGGFDPERAKKIAGTVASEFLGKLKKVQRWMCVQLLIFVVAMVFFGVRFLEGSTPMEWIAYGVLFLMAYETTVLIKLWYWVVNTKISIVRELKQMRLENTSESRPAFVETAKAFTGISRWEWLAWFAAMFLVAILVSVLTATSRGPKLAEADVGLEQYVDLAADGSGKVTTKTFASEGFMPSDTFRVDFAGKEVERVHWYDDQWRELPSDRREVNGVRVYTIHWPHPVLPEERRSYYQVLERAGLATTDGSVWKYRGEWVGCWPTARWRITVRVPTGAEVVQTSPEAYMRGDATGNDDSRRHFVGVGGTAKWGRNWDKNENAKWEVEYRLTSPSEGKDASRP